MMVTTVIMAAAPSRPEFQRNFIWIQTSSGGGNSNNSRWFDCATKYQVPNRIATMPNWIEWMRTLSRLMSASLVGVAGFAHARDRRPDLVAQHGVKLVADGAELRRQHEVR